MKNNFQIMRAALLRVKEARGRDLEYVTLADIDAEVDAALDLPPRNCDVGTAEEQTERFVAKCTRHAYCTPCPVHAAWGAFLEGKPKSCQLIWAQMPYEAKGGAE